MGTVVNFADTTRNCKHWSPEQALEEALKDLRSGEMATRNNGEVGKVTQLSIHFYIEGSDGRLLPCHYVSGMSHAEYIALLTLSLQRGIEDWRDG
jgi:hypothetical protein